MTQHDALLAAVCAAPDDDLPRLVYADWCDVNARPARAEFIRVQIAIANGAKGEELSELELRESQLLDAHHEEWSEPIRQFTDSHLEEALRFRRGFVEDISTNDVLLEMQGDELFAAAPIRCVRLGTQVEYDTLVECDHLLRIRTLDLTGSGLSEENHSSAKLFRSHVLANLEALIARRDSDRDGLDVGALRAIVRSQHLRQLRKVDLGGNGLLNVRTRRERDDLFRILLEVGNFAALSELHLDGVGLTGPDVRQLAACPWLGRLKILDIHNNEAGDEGLLALAGSPFLNGIEWLNVEKNYPSDWDVKYTLRKRFGTRVDV